ncbi:MAG: SusC/RagA family TonB-linked outer membrane protein [Gemmatimonadaceae bacterium]
MGRETMWKQYLQHRRYSLGRGGRLLVAGTIAALALAPSRAVLRAQAATGIIQGTVTDAASGRRLSNAQVAIGGSRSAIGGSQFGAMSTDTGSFRIVGAPVGPATVTVHLIGYSPASKNVIVTAGQVTRVEFVLSQSAVTLSDVVVTGTGGAVEEKKLGNTVAKVNLAQLNTAPITSADEVLQGRVPGVSIQPTGGATGQGATIRIRGSASLSQSNNPIIYIDGVRADNGGGFGSTAAPPPSRLDDMDPQSIDHIEILKGAAAATLYGTEASNGVIQIFTKHGSSGAPHWTVDASGSSSDYPTQRIAPNAGFARTQPQADSLSALFGRPITPFVPFTVGALSQLFTTGRGGQFGMGVEGGADKVTYFVSGRYINENGPFTSAPFNGNTKSANRRYFGTANLNIFPRDKLHLALRTLYSAGHLDGISGNNNIYSPNALALYAKPERAYCLDAAGTKHSLATIVGVDRCQYGGNVFGNTAFATVGEALQNEIYQDESHFNAAVSGTYNATSTLTLDATVGLDNTNARSVGFLPFGNAIDNFTNNAPNGSRNLDVTMNQNVTLETKASWNRPFGTRWSSAFVVGGQGFVFDSKIEGGANQNFPGPGLEVIGAGNQPSIYETLLKNVNAGLFAQEQLGFNNWIFATGGARFDYNSAFGQSAGGVLYPKISLSVVPSDRKSWTSTTLSALRLRAALGESGRQPGAFDKFTTYRPLPSQLGGGLYPANLGNPDLRPEVTREIEAGAELGWFSNRLSTSVTYWHRALSDALVLKQFPISGGFTQTQLANIGRETAHGFDLNAQAFVVNRKDLSLDVFANTAYLYQLVTNLGGAAPLKVGGSYIRYRNFVKEGYAPGAIFGAKLLQSCSSYPAAQATKLLAAQTAPQYGYAMCLQPGQLPYDLNHDGRPDTEQELLTYFQANGATDLSKLNPLRVDENLNGDFLDHYMGKPYPDWSGGFGGHLRIKSIQIGSLFEYNTGNYTIQDLTDAFRQASPSIGRNILASAKVEATLLNPASTPAERLDASKQWLSLVALSPYDGIANQMSSGDFLRWRELNVTYTPSPQLASRLFHSHDASITLGARNLKLWTKYKGVDPEVNQQGISNAGGVDANFIQGIDAFALPLQRRYSLQIRLSY